MNVIIEKYQSKYFLGLKKLLYNVYNSNINQETLENHYQDQLNEIFLAINTSVDEVVGCAFFEEQIDYIRDSRSAYISYVAVDESKRKSGIGRKIFQRIENEAHRRKCYSIELTSADFRTVAHEFYRSIGFTKKKTTVFINEDFRFLQEA